MTDRPVTRQGIFTELPANPRSELVLPWGRTLHMCWVNIRNRRGRFLLVFIGIAVVVAFFTSNLSYHDMIRHLGQSDDVHTMAVLERAGMLSHNEDALHRQQQQRIWLLSLSGLLCLVGIVNTMLMSVFERVREIGTLKCLGALNGFIVRLFMVESVFVGLIASIAGALFGFVLTWIQVGATLEFGLLSASIVVGALIRGVPMAVAIGTVLTILAAVYPTFEAARMKPVDAMRVEI